MPLDSQRGEDDHWRTYRPTWPSSGQGGGLPFPAPGGNGKSARHVRQGEVSSWLFALTYVGRAVTATSFALSACWKITHPTEFRIAYRQIGPRRLGILESGGGRLVAVLETVAAILILLTDVPRLIAVLPSLALLLTLSLALARAKDLSNGCGCWTKPPKGQPRSVYLVRNLLLALFALTGFAKGSASFGLVALALTSGGVISFALMQLPEIRLVWLAGNPGDRGVIT